MSTASRHGVHQFWLPNPCVLANVDVFDQTNMVRDIEEDFDLRENRKIEVKVPTFDVESTLPVQWRTWGLWASQTQRPWIRKSRLPHWRWNVVGRAAWCIGNGRQLQIGATIRTMQFITTQRTYQWRRLPWKIKRLVFLDMSEPIGKAIPGPYRRAISHCKKGNEVSGEWQLFSCSKSQKIIRAEVILCFLRKWFYKLSEIEQIFYHKKKGE